MLKSTVTFSELYVSSITKDETHKKSSLDNSRIWFHMFKKNITNESTWEKELKSLTAIEKIFFQYNLRIFFKDIRTFAARGWRERGSAERVCFYAREKLESS